MRNGQQQLLLPANPLFIWGSLLVALALNMLPLGRAPWRPDLLMLLLVFWGVHQPLRIGMGAAFVFGLCMDVQQSALLGQHALAYTALGYLAIAIHRRLLWFSVLAQAVQVLPLFFAAHAIEVLIRLAVGGIFPGIQVLIAPVLEALLWPLASFVLLAPQRRPPDRDENRPL
ncbi:MAG TPA: rod shape-determining protein MreD [Burkholderiaceae bacterium]